MISVLLVKLGSDGGLRRSRIYGTRIPGTSKGRGDARIAYGSGRRSRTGGRITADQAETSVGVGGNSRIGSTGGRTYGSDERIGVDTAGRGRRIPHILGGGRHHSRVPILMTGFLGALRLGGRVIAIRLLRIVTVQFAGGRRDRSIVRAILRRTTLVQRVMMVLRGGVRRHSQAERESVRGRHRIMILMMVSGRSGRLMVMVAAVKSGLLEIRIHNFFFLITRK